MTPHFVIIIARGAIILREGESLMKTIFPDYKTGMLNLMASLMQHYDVKTPYSTHPIVDKLLAGKYDNVFLILIDGMGSKIIEL